MKNECRSINMMEQAVDIRLPALMKKAGVCTCEQCCADVRALALNRLPARYVVNRVGEAMTQFELLTTQMQAAVVSEILIAIEKVHLNPRHNEGELRNNHSGQ
jgi:competence protein ComFB